MIEELFDTLSVAVSGQFSLAVAAAFGWGVLSILLSPCHISSIPLIIGYISNQRETDFKHSVNLSLVFASGIIITVIVIGLITASLGRIMGDVGIWSNYIVAILLFVIGFHFLGIINFSWSKIPITQTGKRGFAGALIIGLILGLGLGPCTFAFFAPVLGIVFKMANENITKALTLILAFAVGHCILIIIAGSLTQVVKKYLNWTENSKSLRWIKRFSGVLLLVFGIYFIFQSI